MHLIASAVTAARSMHAAHFMSFHFLMVCRLMPFARTVFFHALSCLSQSHLSSFDVISSSSESTCSLVVFHACSSHVKAPDLSSDFSSTCHSISFPSQRDTAAAFPCGRQEKFRVGVSAVPNDVRSQAVHCAVRNDARNHSSAEQNHASMAPNWISPTRLAACPTWHCASRMPGL